MKWKNTTRNTIVTKAPVEDISDIIFTAIQGRGSLVTYNKAEEDPNLFYNRLHNYMEKISQFQTNLVIHKISAFDISDNITYDEFVQSMNGDRIAPRYKYRVAIPNATIINLLISEEMPEGVTGFNGNEPIIEPGAEEYFHLYLGLIYNAIMGGEVLDPLMYFTDLSEDEIRQFITLSKNNKELNEVLGASLHPSVLSRLLLMSTLFMNYFNSSGDSIAINSLAKEVKIQDILNMINGTTNPGSLDTIRPIIRSIMYGLFPALDLGEYTLDNLSEDLTLFFRHYIKIATEFPSIMESTEEQIYNWAKTNLWDYQLPNNLEWGFTPVFDKTTEINDVYYAEVKSTIEVTPNISDPQKYDVHIIATPGGTAGGSINGYTELTDTNSGQSCNFTYSYSTDRNGALEGKPTLIDEISQIGPFTEPPQFEVTDGTTVTANSPIKCLTSDTLITLYDGTTKRADEIEVGDELLCFDRKGRKHKDVVFFTDNYMNNRTDHGYYEVDFSGHKVNIINNHRFYNAAKKSLMHIWDWEIGKDYALLEDGTKVLLTAITFHPCECQHHSIMTKKYRNYLVNGVQSGFSWLSKIRAKLFIRLGFWKGGK